MRPSVRRETDGATNTRLGRQLRGTSQHSAPSAAQPAHLVPLIRISVGESKAQQACGARVEPLGSTGKEARAWRPARCRQRFLLLLPPRAPVAHSTPTLPRRRPAPPAGAKWRLTLWSQLDGPPPELALDVGVALVPPAPPLGARRDDGGVVHHLLREEPAAAQAEGQQAGSVCEHRAGGHPLPAHISCRACVQPLLHAPRCASPEALFGAHKLKRLSQQRVEGLGGAAGGGRVGAAAGTEAKKQAGGGGRGGPQCMPAARAGRQAQPVPICRPPPPPAWAPPPLAHLMANAATRSRRSTEPGGISAAWSSSSLYSKSSAVFCTCMNMKERHHEEAG